MNTNTLLAILFFLICITMVAVYYGPNRKAEEIKACMTQPGMQYVREFGTHYVCIPAGKKTEE